MIDEENIQPQQSAENSQESPPVNDLGEPTTINEQPITNTMEVHHHGHVHEKKKWKEYIFQFFMLFLAVFCGFLAEYQLEHYVEKERAKGLIASLITDLRKDTATINTLEKFRLTIRKPRLDSFYSLVTMPPGKVEKKIYYQLLWNIAEFYSFNQSTGTINQLKNAGYLRYFSDNDLLNLISDYEYWIHDFKGDETMEFHLHYDKLMETIKQNSNVEDMHTFYILNKLPEGTGIKAFKPEVLQSLKAYLIEVMWYNHPQMQKQNERIKGKAVALLNYLQATYKIRE